MEHPRKKLFKILTLFGLILGILLAVGTSVYFKTLFKESADTLVLTQAYVVTKEQELEHIKTAFSDLEKKYTSLEKTAHELEETLSEERARNEEFEEQIQEISGTVGILDKLSKTDKELLQKYSKVYFLNEHYTPPDVLPLAREFLSRPDDVPEYVHARVAPFLNRLLRDAQDDGIALRVLSGYRSFDEQKQLKGAYSVQYGIGANTFSADQGYSEHQLGTTVDFSTEEMRGGLTDFQNTEAYAWLVKNAHHYGFTLSYPEGNEYYVYEPWHWRFVGKALADTLYEKEKHFYDLEQREIDTYLVSFFD